MSYHSFYEESVADDSERLFSGFQYELIREGNRIIFESRSCNSTGAKIFSVFSFLLSLMTITQLMDRLNRGMPLTFLNVMLIMLPIVLGMAGILHSVRPRRCILDFESKTCTFRHLPLLAYRISFSDIKSIDVLKLKWSHKIILSVTYRKKRHRLRIHEFSRKTSPVEEIEQDLPKITNLLSMLIDKPVREIENATAGMSVWA